MKRVTVLLLTYAAAISTQSFLVRIAWYRDLYRGYPFWVPESLKNAAGIAICIVVATILYGARDHFALRRGALRGLLFGLAASSPMLLTFAVTRRVAIEDGFALVFLGVLFPFAEEIISRGFAFRALYAREGWPWWAAALVVALITGAVHVEKGQTPLQVLGLFAVTGIGGALFSWLLARWDSLWFPFALHAMMNTWWGVFSVSDTALGGWIPFAAQIASVVAAIGITLKLTPGTAIRDHQRGKTNGEEPPAIYCNAVVRVANGMVPRVHA